MRYDDFTTIYFLYKENEQGDYFTIFKDKNNNYFVIYEDFPYVFELEKRPLGTIRELIESFNYRLKVFYLRENRK